MGSGRGDHAVTTSQRPIFHGWPERHSRLLAATLALLQNYAGIAESRMKSRAPWIDRTGHARQGLHATAVVVKVPTATKMSLTLNHSMEYGKWLETVNGPAMGSRASMGNFVGGELEKRENIGNYAVIHPTADAIGPGLQEKVKRIWGRPETGAI